MKILYDYQTFHNQFGGIARYHYELSNGMRCLDVKTEIATLISPNHYLLNDPSYKVCNPLGEKHFKGRYRLIEYIKQINKLYSEIRIANNQFDIFHPTYYDPYFENFLHKPFVVTVHDFVHEKYDQLRTEDINNKHQLIMRSNKIIAISNNTKKDIIDYYNIPEEKIEVIYHGIHSRKQYLLNNPFGKYVLYVGDRKGYKNFARFFSAISIILRKEKEINLVCTGSSFSTEEIEIIEKEGVRGQVFQVSANETQLNSLYNHAITLVYPSLYEGFGMPILEAFANECPICLSNSSCFPEIAADAALYFDPTSTESISNCLERIIMDKTLHHKLVKLGSNRIKDFSWKKTVLKTHEIYESIL